MPSEVKMIIGSNQDVANYCWRQLTKDDPEIREDFLNNVMLEIAGKGLLQGISPTSPEGLHLVLEHFWKLGFGMGIEAMKIGAVSLYKPEDN